MALTSVSKFSKVNGIPLSAGDMYLMNPGLLHAAATQGDEFATGIYFLLVKTLSQKFSLARLDGADFSADKRLNAKDQATGKSQSLTMTRERQEETLSRASRCIEFIRNALIDQNIFQIPSGCLSSEELKGILDFVKECKDSGMWRTLASNQ